MAYFFFLPEGINVYAKLFDFNGNNRKLEVLRFAYRCTDVHLFFALDICFSAHAQLELQTLFDGVGGMGGWVDRVLGPGNI